MDLCTNESSPVQLVPLEEPNYLNDVGGGDDHGDSNVPIALNGHTSLSKRNLHTSNEEQSVPIECPKKARVSVKAKKSTNIGRSKNAQKNAEVGLEEGSNAALKRQSSSNNISDNDSNTSEELTEGGGASCSSKETATLNVNGKTRASRGSAVDPQSLYARKRRERINERLRILQNLVPNGTKVDISTMLEEAVEYVKFLQLQIKDGHEVFFKIKRSTLMRKLMTAYCDRQSVDINSIAFLFDGRRLRAEQTPDELEMEDGDEIDAMLHQTDGGLEEAK